MSLDHLSFCTTYIILKEGDKEISQGTGFYYCHVKNDKTFVYLITNHHVITGFPPEDKNDPKGDNITFYLHKSKDNLKDIKEIVMPLYIFDKPLWINPSSYPKADLAIIPLNNNQVHDCFPQCITSKFIEVPYILRPATPLTLIGYPYGLYDQSNYLPIWKTGTFASEPSIDFEGQPLFIADVSAFPGMSGSPVFAIATGMYEKEEGIVTSGWVKKFLGIYASNYLWAENIFLEELITNNKKGIKHEESLQLGNVWKAKIIEETINKIDIQDYIKNIEDYLKSIKE